MCVCACVHYVFSCTGSTKSSPWYSPKWSSPCWAAAHDICKLLKRAAQVPLGSTTTTPPRPSTRSFIYARARSLASSGVFPREHKRMSLNYIIKLCTVLSFQISLPDVGDHKVHDKEGDHANDLNAMEWISGDHINLINTPPI